jgi:hypothetical protein
MTFRLGIPGLFLALACPLVSAQQTGGAVGSTPGSAVRNFPQPARVMPTLTCDSPASPQTNDLPDMIFERDNLVCIRHNDGRAEKLLSDIPSGRTSADGNHVAYWVSETHELHVLSVADRSHTIVDTVPGATLRDMVWSMKGHTLAYFLAGTNPPLIRAINLDTGRRNSFQQSFRGFVAYPDPEYIAFIGALGIERFRLADGHRGLTIPAKFADRAAYSRSGELLGILSYTTSKFLNSTPVAAAATMSDDDAPDCTGGAFYLILQLKGRKQLVDVPFPEKFDTVLDFEISPDESSLAITFGVTGCDYPGDAARVYTLSLPDLTLTPISRSDHLSVEAHWSPTGKNIIYADYTENGVSLVAADPQTGKLTRLTNPQGQGMDRWLGWR